jgi:hypothetical protein
MVDDTEIESKCQSRIVIFETKLVLAVRSKYMCSGMHMFWYAYFKVLSTWTYC